MQVNISYGDFKFFNEVSKATYSIQEPHIDIHLHPNNPCSEGWHEDKNLGRTLRIIKIYAEKSLRDSKANSDCVHTIKIILLTPGEECIAFDGALKPLKNCNCSACIPSMHSNHFPCSPQEAHLALGVILSVSKDFFNTQDAWLEDVKQFIDCGPHARKQLIQLDPTLEAEIRRVLGEQQGAINLLEDLKTKPFKHSVETILKSLLEGIYGDFSSQSFPEHILYTDLEKRDLKDLAVKASQGRYNHNGPNIQENLNALFSHIKSLQ